MTAAIRLLVRGRVQGVGFRWFVRELAREAGLHGWVRNNPDGSVELVAAGSASALDRLEGAVREGPPGADVRDVTRSAVHAEEPLPDPFTVHR